MQILSQDIRYAVRQLINSPTLTLTAVVSLALGIGATTAVFSVLYAALIHPYPFREADRIMRLTVIDIYLRDNHTCQYCSRRFHGSELTLDHVLPRSRGGRNTW